MQQCIFITSKRMGPRPHPAEVSIKTTFLLYLGHPLYSIYFCAALFGMTVIKEGVQTLT